MVRILVISTALLPLAVLAAEDASYRVTPIVAPAAERPAAKVAKEKLPSGTAGALPRRDGDRFSVSMPSRARISTQGEARPFLDRILGAVGAAAEFKPRKDVVHPGASSGAVERMQGSKVNEFKKSVERKVGKLSRATEAQIEAEAREASRSAAAARRTFVFQQQFGGVPVEAAAIQIANLPQGRVAVTGKVYAEVKPANRSVLGADQAVARASAHVARTTRVVNERAAGPVLVLLPYGESFRFAWRLDVAAAEGEYRIWVDADSGAIVQLEPLFDGVDAQGLVFNPDPAAGTLSLRFSIDPGTSNQFRLVETSEIDENNAGADGTSGDLVLTSTSTSVDFNVAPINGTVVDRTASAGYNGRFQEVNAFGWVHWTKSLLEALGSQPFPALTVTVNHSNPCGFGINNACGGASGVTFGIGQATISNSSAFNDLFNTGIDTTIVIHELGHVLNRNQFAASGGALTGAVNEGLADFWAETWFNTPVVGQWSAQNRGAPQQTGRLPRRSEAQDVFPERRALSSGSHADGEMLSWALWSTREGLGRRIALAALVLDMELLDATAAAGVGVTSGETDRAVHDAYLDLLQQLAIEFSGAGTVNKVLAGFARAGLLLDERDAVIDIDDDFLVRGGATAPTFTIWTGRDYQFTATGTTGATNAFNGRFEVEIANDAAFTVNRRTSGPLGGVAVSVNGTPQATWTVPPTDWALVNQGNALFYRVTTSDATGSNVRLSTSPGNGFLTVPPPSAVLNETGSGPTICCGRRGGAAGVDVAWVLLLPGLALLARRTRAQKPR